MQGRGFVSRYIPRKKTKSVVRPRHGAYRASDARARGEILPLARGVMHRACE